MPFPEYVMLIFAVAVGAYSLLAVILAATAAQQSQRPYLSEVHIDRAYLMTFLMLMLGAASAFVEMLALSDKIDFAIDRRFSILVMGLLFSLMASFATYLYRVLMAVIFSEVEAPARRSAYVRERLRERNALPRR